MNSPSLKSKNSIKGGTLVEYVLITAIVVAAIWGFTTILKNASNGYYANSNNSFNYVTDDVLIE